MVKFTLENSLHDWKNFGRRSARELAARIRESIQTPDVSTDGNISLKTYIADELDQVSERNARILSDRIGLNGAWRTLEAIARDHAVTRQRVEQIVSKWLKSTENRPWRTRLLREMETALADRHEPLYLDLLDNENSWFAGWPEPLNLGNAIEVFTAGKVRVINVSGLYVITRLTQQSWDRLPSQVLGYLKSLGPSLTESETHLAVEGFAEGHEAKGLGELLYLAIRHRLQFARQGGETTLASIGAGLTHHVKAVLDAAERPLHYTEIAERCGERMSKEVNPAAAGNFLPAAGAKYYGRGCWGQSRHFALSDSGRDALVQAAEAIAVAGQPERQWHVEELLAEISKHSTEFRATDKYTLNYALESSKTLVSKGRLVWAVRSHSARERIDVAMACEKIVREAGRPLTRSELIKALSKHRGLGKYMTITPKAQLVRVSPNTWGLLERDLGLTSGQATELLERLHKTLSAGGKSLDENELRVFAKAEGAVHLTPYLLLSLAQRDTRFSLQRGRCLGLAVWRSGE